MTPPGHIAQSSDWLLVDARWLEPPEPMERVLAALDRLRPGQAIRLLIHRDPLPLYDLLERMGFSHSLQRIEDGCFAIEIRPPKPD
jgi:uncharacterized protein (DUF2249 family)